MSFHTAFITALEIAFHEFVNVTASGEITFPDELLGHRVRIDYAPTLFYGRERGRAQWFNLHRGFEPERMPRSLGHRPAARRLFGFSPVQRRQTKRRRYLARLRRA